MSVYMKITDKRLCTPPPLSLFSYPSVQSFQNKKSVSIIRRCTDGGPSTS